MTSVLQGSITPFIQPDGSFVFTLTSNGYKFYTLNLLKHLQRIGVPWKLCIVCADNPSYLYFYQEGIPCRKMKDLIPDVSPRISPFGTRNFQTLNRKKLDLLAEFTAKEEIRTGLYLDGDIAVYKDPMPPVQAAFATAPPTTNLLLQCDEKTRVDCSGSPCPNGCTGVIAWRHGVPPALFQVAGKGEVWRSQPEDQVFVNKMAANLGVPFQTLSRPLFPNGQFVSLFRAGAPSRAAAVLLHYNWMVGDSKKKAMRENEDWIIPY